MALSSEPAPEPGQGEAATSSARGTTEDLRVSSTTSETHALQGDETGLNLDGDASAQSVALPATPAQRMFTGLIALTLPRAIAVRLDLLDIRGGRGLWAFADLDTLFFDATLILAIVSLVVAFRRGTVATPLMVLVLFTTFAIGGGLAYVVSNYGTLFRLREMIWICLALIPFVVSGEKRNVATVPDHESLADHEESVVARSGEEHAPVRRMPV